MADPDDRPVDIPAFAYSLRGYDRSQVDLYVRRLTRLLEDERSRGRDAEDRVGELRRRLEESQLRADRVEEAGEAGGQEGADALLAEAREQAAELLRAADKKAEQSEEHARMALRRAESRLERAAAEARAVAEDVRAQAQEESAHVVAEARRSATQIVSEAGSQQRSMDEQTDRMRADAQEEALRVIADARRRAEEITAQAGAQQGALDGEFAALRADREATASALRELADRILATGGDADGDAREGDAVTTRPLGRWRTSAAAAARGAED